MQRARRRVVGIAVVVGAVALAGLALSPDRVLERLAALRSRPAAFAAVVTALYLVRPLVAWPLSLCSAVVGYGYELVGLPFALVGVCVTCLPPYVLGRYAGGDTVGESGLVGRLSGSGERFVERTGGVRGVAAARLAPLPADPVSVGAGLSGVGFGSTSAERFSARSRGRSPGCLQDGRSTGSRPRVSPGRASNSRSRRGRSRSSCSRGRPTSSCATAVDLTRMCPSSHRRRRGAGRRTYSGDDPSPPRRPGTAAPHRSRLRRPRSRSRSDSRRPPRRPRFDRRRYPTRSHRPCPPRPAARG